MQRDFQRKFLPLHQERRIINTVSIQYTAGSNLWRIESRLVAFSHVKHGDVTNSSLLPLVLQVLLRKMFVLAKRQLRHCRHRISALSLLPLYVNFTLLLFLIEEKPSS